MNTQNDNNDTNKFAQILLRDYIQSDFVNENDLNEIESYELLIDYVSQIHEHVINNDVFVNVSIENDLYDIHENFIYIQFRLNYDDELNQSLKFNVDDDDIKFILNHKCVCNDDDIIREYDNNIDMLIFDQKTIIDYNKKIEIEKYINEYIDLKKHLFNEKQLIFLNMLFKSNKYAFNQIDEITSDLQKSQFVCLHESINDSFSLISINNDFDIDITNNHELLQYVKTHNCELQIDLSYDVDVTNK